MLPRTEFLPASVGWTSPARITKTHSWVTDQGLVMTPETGEKTQAALRWGGRSCSIALLLLCDVTCNAAITSCQEETATTGWQQQTANHLTHVKEKVSSSLPLPASPSHLQWRKSRATLFWRLQNTGSHGGDCEHYCLLSTRLHGVTN
jgi:hypothetical protein